jgi:hypothetical protein
MEAATEGRAQRIEAVDIGGKRRLQVVDCERPVYDINELGLSR